MAIHPHSPEVNALIELVNGNKSDAGAYVREIKKPFTAMLRVSELQEMIKKELELRAPKFNAMERRGNAD